MALTPDDSRLKFASQYPDLGTGPISLEDSLSPEFFELEREAIWRRTWLCVGRVEQVAKQGSYFTREIAVCNTSILIVRGADNRIRAFHNMCSHRGNKLAWSGDYRLETRGMCRQFTCKYHGWRYGLDGSLTHITQEEDYPELDKRDYGLTPVALDLWEGFIFVNLDSQPRQTLAEFLGEMGEGLKGYPFHQLTQVYGHRGVLNCNWKLDVDGFQEGYHAPYLHTRLMNPEGRADFMTSGWQGSSYKLLGPHRLWTSSGVGNGQIRPIERLLQAGLGGSFKVPDIGLREFPKLLNVNRDRDWGADLFQIFPNYVIFIYASNIMFTYQYWPLDVDHHIFEGRTYYVPPKNAGERLAQEISNVSFKEYWLQDANALEACYGMLKSRAKTRFPLSDQEIQIRHFHKVVNEYVNAYLAERESGRTENNNGNR